MEYIQVIMIKEPKDCIKENNCVTYKKRLVSNAIRLWSPIICPHSSYAMSLEMELAQISHIPCSWQENSFHGFQDV